jgi:1,4-dihydroxy-6-naphthoate synthase
MADTARKMVQKVRIAHSPDSDDAFMFAGLALGEVRDDELELVHELVDIETLNRRALEGTHELTAISFHAYPHVAARYALLDVGASFGDRYGPVLVAAKPMTLAEAAAVEIAVPGQWTTAHLALKLMLPGARVRFVPFDQVLDEVRQGKAAAGIIIHEGQLTYRELGFAKVADLGEWWGEETGLPLPLGGNAVRRDLGPERMRRLAALLRDSVSWGLKHRERALAHAATYGRGLDAARLDRFVGMYVNRWTEGLGERGRGAVAELLGRGARVGLVPPCTLDWVS